MISIAHGCVGFWLDGWNSFLQESLAIGSKNLSNSATILDEIDCRKGYGKVGKWSSSKGPESPV
jgi:hypothetical protein